VGATFAERAKRKTAGAYLNGTFRQTRLVRKTNRTLGCPHTPKIGSFAHALLVRKVFLSDATRVICAPTSLFPFCFVYRRRVSFSVLSSPFRDYLCFASVERRFSRVIYSRAPIVYKRSLHSHVRVFFLSSLLLTSPPAPVRKLRKLRERPT